MYEIDLKGVVEGAAYRVAHFFGVKNKAYFLRELVGLHVALPTGQG